MSLALAGAPSARDSSCGVAWPPEDTASDIATAGWLIGTPPLASAVWVCSRNDVDAGGSPIIGCARSAWPTVDLSSSFASEIAGLIGVSASDALSDFGASGASACGSAAGCGATFSVASSGCEKLAGLISPGVTTTRAPILVQFHIFMANAIGIRMQPCDAG